MIIYLIIFYPFKLLERNFNSHHEKDEAIFELELIGFILMFYYCFFFLCVIGVPWTEEEHRLFLLGLQKVGKEDWRGIFRNFVKTRTPTRLQATLRSTFYGGPT